jgi:hypothetical protein
MDFVKGFGGGIRWMDLVQVVEALVDGLGGGFLR